MYRRGWTGKCCSYSFLSVFLSLALLFRSSGSVFRVFARSLSRSFSIALSCQVQDTRCASRTCDRYFGLNTLQVRTSTSYCSCFTHFSCSFINIFNILPTGEYKNLIEKKTKTKNDREEEKSAKSAIDRWLDQPRMKKFYRKIMFSK